MQKIGNWRNRSIEAWEARWGKERNRRKGNGKTGQSRALHSVWDSSHRTWQAAVGAAWSASQWRGAEDADVTRERAISVAKVAQPGFTGLPFHTSRYIDGPACPPIIIFMRICTIMLFSSWRSAFPSFFGIGTTRSRQSHGCRTFVINSATLLQLKDPHPPKC